MNKYLLGIIFFINASLPAFAQNMIGGIGAQLFIDTAGGFTMPRIMSLIPNYPAYDKLKATDFIMSVNGINCKDKAIEEVVGMIRGDTGTIVHIIVADTKLGARPREYDLKRVNIPQAAPPNPAISFNAWCEDQVKQLKGKGYEILKTFTSECGNYFFNFNAESGGYHIRVYTLEEKGAGAYTPGFYATAKVFDGNNEPAATELSKMAPIAAGNSMIAQLEGSVTFTRDCVGVAGITIHDDIKKCRGMYIIVYR